MTGLRGALALLLATTIAATGCGEDRNPRPVAAPEQDVLVTVTGFWDAVRERDGEAACAAVTEPGRRLFVRWSADPPDGQRAESCPDAVAMLADAIAHSDAAPVTGAGGSFSADDVSIDGDRAEVQCRYRGAMLLRRIGGEWLIRIPACTD